MSGFSSGPNSAEVEQRLDEAQHRPDRLAQHESQLLPEDQSRLAPAFTAVSASGWTGSSRSECPVSVRKTSSSVGRAICIEATGILGRVERPHERQRPLFTAIDGHPHRPFVLGRLAHAGLRDQQRPRPLGLRPDGEHHQIAGDPALERVGRPLGDDLPVVDDQDPIAERVGLVEVVGGEKDGRPELVAQPADVVPEVGAALGIEAGRRLVEEDQPGRVNQPERDVEPPLLTARQRLDLALAEIGEIEPRAHLGGAPLGLRGGEAVELRLQHQLLVDQRAGVGAAALRDVADPPPHADRIAPQIAAGHRRLAGGRRQQRREHPLGGGLTGAVRTEEPDHLARRDGEVDARHRRDGAGARLEGAPETARLDHRLISPRPPFDPG